VNEMTVSPKTGR